ncbi:MAG: hypothetical protein IPN17_21220 [Deltaproteobacteria bacterium]|nr:hypothetical protein [Deltaproteobacteria bacterium]
MHTKVRRGARELEGGGAEFVLWAPSHGNVQIERVDVRAEGLTAPVLPTELTEDGHWVARGRIVAPRSSTTSRCTRCT